MTGHTLTNFTRPNHFIELTKVTGASEVHHINIQNYPVHCFSISNSAGLDIHHITLNNSAGYAPNARSNGLPASHNSDGTYRFLQCLVVCLNFGGLNSSRYVHEAYFYLGFDLASSNDTQVRDSIVINQDDCVAITSGNNIHVSHMYCNGSHGLSIGSVGGKSSMFSSSSYLTVRLCY